MCVYHNDMGLQIYADRQDIIDQLQMTAAIDKACQDEVQEAVFDNTKDQEVIKKLSEEQVGGCTYIVVENLSFSNQG